MDVKRELSINLPFLEIFIKTRIIECFLKVEISATLFPKSFPKDEGKGG